jgi:hypothetical protein
MKGRHFPPQLERIVQKANTQIDHLSKFLLDQRRQLLECKSPKTYVEKLHQYVNNASKTINSCIECLAEEQRVARRWRSQCERMAQHFEELRRLFTKEKKERQSFYRNRQHVTNVLLPIATRPLSISKKLTNSGWADEESIARLTELRVMASSSDSQGQEFEPKADDHEETFSDLEPSRKVPIFMPSLEHSSAFGVKPTKENCLFDDI